MDQFQEQCLIALNTYRLHHHCQEVDPSDELQTMAQEWADRIAEKGFLQYSENAGVGENICILDQDGIELPGEEVIKHWYEERHLYDFEKPGWQKGTSNFSQMVWKGAKEVGIGKSKLKNEDKVVVVAFYKPPGNSNLPGQYRDNVLPPRSTADL